MDAMLTVRGWWPRWCPRSACRDAARCLIGWWRRPYRAGCRSPTGRRRILFRCDSRQRKILGLVNSNNQEPWLNWRRSLAISRSRCIKRGSGWLLQRGWCYSRRRRRSGSSSRGGSAEVGIFQLCGWNVRSGLAYIRRSSKCDTIVNW